MKHAHTKSMPAASQAKYTGSDVKTKLSQGAYEMGPDRNIQLYPESTLLCLCPFTLKDAPPPQTINEYFFAKLYQLLFRFLKDNQPVQTYKKI